MHEVGLAEAVLDSVERRANGRTVQRVRVRAGVLNRVDEESMRQAFALVGEGSVADSATLELDVVPVQVACADCGEQSTAPEVVVACPRCGGMSVELSGGDELTLVSLDIAAEPVPG
jgi:hydrogenase nickel incorporation protein HypA/HybF